MGHTTCGRCRFSVFVTPPWISQVFHDPFQKGARVGQDSEEEGGPEDK